MLSVQVERDPKTGATVVRSVASVSTPTGAPTAATAVFDDGRKSIHAVGAPGGELSTEELGQILSVVDGVGMTALLDDLRTEAASADGGAAAPEVRVVSFSSRRAVEAELGVEERFASVAHEEHKKEGGVTAAVAGEVGDVEDLRLDEGPVTLVFLGYTDGDQEDGREENGGMLTAERVIITEEGEERVVGPETPEAKESRVFQDIPLDGDGNGAGAGDRGDEGGDGRQNSSSPTRAAAKSKSCQCCSVM